MNHGALVEGHVKSSVSIGAGQDRACFAASRITLGIPNPDAIAPLDLQSARVVHWSGLGSPKVGE